MHCSFVLEMPSGRTNNVPKSGRGLGHVTPTIFLSVRSAILATAWLLVYHLVFIGAYLFTIVIWQLIDLILSWVSRCSCLSLCVCICFLSQCYRTRLPPWRPFFRIFQLCAPIISQACRGDWNLIPVRRPVPTEKPVGIPTDYGIWIPTEPGNTPYLSHIVCLWHSKVTV